MISETAEGALEGEINLVAGQAVELRQEDLACFHIGHGGLERREPGGDEVGVDEMNNAAFPGQKLAGESGLTCTVGPGDYQAKGGTWNWSARSIACKQAPTIKSADRPWRASGRRRRSLCR